MHNRVRHRARRDERLCKQLGSVERYAMVGKMGFLWLFYYFAVASVEKIILEVRAVHLRAWHNTIFSILVAIYASFWCIMAVVFVLLLVCSFVIFTLWADLGPYRPYCTLGISESTF